MAEVQAPKTIEVLPNAAPQPYQRDVAPAGAFGFPLAQAASEAGQTLGQAATALQGIQNETDATNKASVSLANLGDIKAKYDGLKGDAYVKAVPAYQQDVLKWRDAALASATNPQEKRMLAENIQRISSYTLEGIGARVGPEKLQASVDASQGSAEQIANFAVRVRNDPTALQGLLQQGQGEIAKIGEVSGWGPDLTKAKQQAYAGKFYSPIIGVLASENPQQAKATLDQAAPLMDAESQERIAQTITPKLRTYAADQLGAQMLQSTVPAKPPVYVPSAVRPQLLQQATEGTDVPANVADALIQHESNYNINAVSPTGAQGLAQVLPSTAAKPGYNMGPLTSSDPVLNAKFGVAYLERRGDEANGGKTDWNDPAQVRKALIAYHGNDAAAPAYADAVVATAFKQPGAKPPPDYRPAPDLGTWLQRAQVPGDPIQTEMNEAKVHSTYALWQSATAADRAALNKQIGNVSAALGDGKVDVAIPEQQIRSLYPPEQADEIVTHLQEQQQAGLVMQSVRFADPSQLTSMREQLQAGVGPAGAPIDLTEINDYRLRSLKAQAFDKAYALRVGGLSSDPAAYVQQSPIVSAALRARVANPNDPSAAQYYFQTSLAEQARLGVPEDQRSILSTDAATNEAHKLNALDMSKEGGDATQVLASMKQQYGGYWNQAFRDIVTRGGLNPQYKVLAAMPDGTLAQTNLQRALEFISTNKGGMNELKQNAGKQNVQAIDAAFDGGNNKIDADPTLAKMATSVSLSSAGIDGMDDVRNSVKTLAYYLMQSGQAKTPADAVTKSTQWINDKYDFVGMTRVPKGLGDAFEMVAQNTLDALKPSDIAQTYQKLPYLEANEEASYTRAAKNGVWVTNGNDDGAVLMGNFGNGVFLPIMRAGKDSSGNPQPMQIKFSDVPTMRNAIRSAPADSSLIPELGTAPSDVTAVAGTE